MKEIADLYVSLPVEVEYEVTDDTITANRVWVIADGQRVDVTSRITEDDWTDILWSIQTDYVR